MSQDFRIPSGIVLDGVLAGSCMSWVQNWIILYKAWLTLDIDRERDEKSEQPPHSSPVIPY